MAKSDLLKQAIADAKAVKETALANAKIALQEAFMPRLENMLATKLTNEIEGEEEEAPAVEEPADEMGADNMGEMPTNVKVGLDFNDDGDWDIEGTLGAEEEVPAEEEPVASEEDMTAEYNEGYGDVEEGLGLDEIIRELEGDLDGDEMVMSRGLSHGDEDELENEGMYEGYEEEDITNESLDELIEAILREDEMMMGPEDVETVSAEEEDVLEAMSYELEEKEQELEEAYRTVKRLQSTINEVNLLNAKLLYTNKLFRNFELTEAQKMKVIENFDRASNTRETKLVFTTLAESFNKPAKKRVVKESYASKPTTTTAPSKQTTQVLSEGFELANRWKKLAGLL
jgi:hypothetical protein